MLRYFLIFFFLFLPLITQGALLDVVINEICWMGTDVSSSDEWIELYNNTNQDIDLFGWGIYEGAGETLIEPLTGIIKTKSYYLIERTNDDTVPDMPANQEPSGWSGHGLKNSGEHLQLLDNNSTVIDEIICSEGWFSGDSKNKRTMERINPEISGNDPSNWQTSENPLGTPNQENFGSEQTPKSPNFPTSPTAPIPNDPNIPKLPNIPKTYPKGIVFNEIIPSPEGPDSENEVIEIYNQNDFGVDLENWQIKDRVGKTKTFTFAKGTKIFPNGYLTLSRRITKITLNNGGDTLVLLNPNNEIIDSVSYPKAVQDQSYNRFDSGWAWSPTITLGKQNIIPEKPAEPRPAAAGQTKYPETGSPEPIKLGDVGRPPADYQKTAAVSEKISIPKINVFLIAFILAIFSGIIIFILKRKLEEI